MTIAVTDEMKARLRDAKKKLAEAQCTCAPDPRGHDMWWLECARTRAEIEVDEALCAMGLEL